MKKKKKKKPIPPIKIKNPEPGRNDPCPCGSGRKYKKCCLIIKQERERLMSEEQKEKLPTFDEAVKWLLGYTKQRQITHNMTVQCIFNAILALKALPVSPDRDLCITDFERRLNEYVGDGAGKDAQVTFALSRLMVEYQPKVAPETVAPPPAPEKPETEGPILVQNENKPIEEVKPQETVPAADDVISIIEDDTANVAGDETVKVSDDETLAAQAEQEVEAEEVTEQQDNEEKTKDDAAADSLGSEV